MNLKQVFGLSNGIKLGRFGINQGGAVDPIPALLEKFALSGSSVALFKDALGYQLLIDLGNGLCVSYAMNAVTYNVDQNVPRIRYIRTRNLYANVDKTDVSLTYSGANWTAPAGSGGYNTTYRRTSTAGEYVQWTSGAGVTQLYVWSITSPTNAGVALVTIDGSPTAATGLPTAQQLVDAGTLANTVLVANGGTLNPTDRVWNQYANANRNGGKELVTGLAAGAHTVRLTCTGYKQAESTDVRMYFSGFGYWSSGVTLKDATATPTPGVTIADLDGRWEYALNYKPTGGSSYEFMGHTNTDKLTSVAFEVDDTPVASLTSYDANQTGWMSAGDKAEIITVSYFRHSQSVPNVATNTLTYTALATGLTQSHTTTWSVAGTQSTAYPAMMPLPSTFDKGSNVGLTVDVTLSADDDSYVANAQSKAVYMWQAAGNWGALLYIPDLATLNNFVDCDALFFAIQDRSDLGMNKAYAFRSDKAVAIAENDVWTADAEWRIKYFSGGANAILARA